MRNLICAFIAVGFGQSANACFGGATNIRYEQIEAVNEAVLRDNSVNFKGIDSLIIKGDQVIVRISDFAGNSSVRIYRTVASKDSGPGTGNCDKVDAILLESK